jgi:hypothetical protein
MAGVLIRSEKTQEKALKTDMKGDYHVTTKAETQVLLLKVKEHKDCQ